MMTHPAVQLKCTVCDESLFIKAGDEEPDEFIDLVESYGWVETSNGWLCDDCAYEEKVTEATEE
jgi:hypothetical protein